MKNIVTVFPGGTVYIEGRYFGEKIPKVSLEAGGKLIRCKVDKTGLKYLSYKNKPSCMDPETGESVIKVVLPVKNLPSGVYPLILDNKIGIATTPVTESDKGHLPVIEIK
jgi:hypothetical protein